MTNELAEFFDLHWSTWKCSVEGCWLLLPMALLPMTFVADDDEDDANDILDVSRIYCFCFSQCDHKHTFTTIIFTKEIRWRAESAHLSQSSPSKTLIAPSRVITNVTIRIIVFTAYSNHNSVLRSSQWEQCLQYYLFYWNDYIKYISMRNTANEYLWYYFLLSFFLLYRAN